MVRKRDRVIGTLVIWIAVIAAMSRIFEVLNRAPFHLHNSWYASGSVLVGQDSESALRVWEDVQSMSSNIYTQTYQFIQTELFSNHLPYLLLIVAALLVGAVIGTLFIWRSVIVPAGMSESIVIRTRSNEREERPPITALLEDDGELIEPIADPEPTHNHRER